MSESIDHCRMAFEKFASRWGVRDEMLQRREVMDRDKYADHRIQAMWQRYRAGWDRISELFWRMRAQ